MFYLTKIILGTETCIHSSPTDIYTNNFNIDCSGFVPAPGGLKEVRSIKIKCTGSPVLIDGKVYKS